MANSNHLADYPNERAALDTALRHSGLRLTFPTAGKAMYFRARLNKFKQLLRRHVAESHKDIPGYIPTTPYDNLVVRYNDRERGEDGKPSSREVRIDLRDETFEAQIVNADGQRVQLDFSGAAALATPDDDAYADAIADLAGQIDLDTI